MFCPIDRKLSVLLTLLFLSFPAHRALAQTGTISGSVVTRDGQPLAYANVVLVGTTMGGMALADGSFAIRGVPPGTYTVRVLMMGYEKQDRGGVIVKGDEVLSMRFELKESIVSKTQVIVVKEGKLLDTKAVVHIQGTSNEQMKTMPIDNPKDVVGIMSGVVEVDGEFHVQGQRSSAVQTQIDGVPVTDPLGAGELDVNILATASTELISGGMDAEYGDAQAAVINMVTREGGQRFSGEVRYFTDDFGRQDKTYTNYDRISIGFGGPTMLPRLRYFVSGEATFTDTENSTIEQRAEHKITNWLKFRDRQHSSVSMQSKLSYHPNRMKITGEAIMARARRDSYWNEWNVSGFVGKVHYFQGVEEYGVREAGSPEVMTFTRVVHVPHGEWAQITSAGERERRLNIRSVVITQQVRDPVTENAEVVRYDNFRVADLNINGNRQSVVWDEAILAADGLTPLYYKSWKLFEGFQYPFSEFSGVLRDPEGADSAYVPFNSAERTPQTSSSNLHLKLGFNHNVTSKLLYAINLSRLEFNTTMAVVDEEGNPKAPAEYASAGLPVTLPDGTYLEGGLTDASWYTDDAHPYFITAYDYPWYSNQKTIQYLTKFDVTSEQLKGHRIKSGIQVIYNDLSSDERLSPAMRRLDGDTGMYRQGLNANIYHNYNVESALYAQDKWEYEGMVINGGMRYEWFDVGNNASIEVHNSEISPEVDKVKWNLSPRLGVAFPITDRDKFFFHYGRFTQWPSRTYLFRTQDAVGAVGVLGNPDLQPQLTVSYQAGIAHQFDDDTVGHFIIFNRDVYGLVSSAPVTDDSSGVRGIRYTNRTYASARGLEVTLERRLTRRFGFEAYYTYSFADGVASSADFGLSADGLTHLPTDELPLDWDQRHTFNVTLRLMGSRTWGASAVYRHGSGRPWTPYDRFARLQDPTWENSRRLENTNKLNVQGRRIFNIYGRQLTFYFEGRNLLDDDVLRGSGTNPTTGVPMRFAQMDNGSYLTETGRYGGAYMKDGNDDGLNEFYPVHDPTIWEQHRLWRLGIGFEF